MKTCRECSAPESEDSQYCFIRGKNLAESAARLCRKTVSIDFIRGKNLAEKAARLSQRIASIVFICGIGVRMKKG